jgi:hypothetical protein
MGFWVGLFNMYVLSAAFWVALGGIILYQFVLYGGKT